jgi:hypothetical protein
MSAEEALEVYQSIIVPLRDGRASVSNNSSLDCRLVSILIDNFSNELRSLPDFSVVDFSGAYLELTPMDISSDGKKYLRKIYDRVRKKTSVVVIDRFAGEVTQSLRMSKAKAESLKFEDFAVEYGAQAELNANVTESSFRF